ncbi:MAG TPA: hypothetical protein IAC86_03310 [Candidatus Cryptobacteroides excrementigallinarum]|nr:hypothetical protein [Candidatus Cryptobacteroides excrementigallinarum]
MKKWIIVAAFASAILAGCTKNEVRVDVPDQAISFQTIVGKNSTKALVSETEYPTTVPFGTVAWYLESGNWAANYANAVPYIGVNSSGVVAGEEVDYYQDGNYWKTEDDYFWPKSGSLTFFSFSPYETDFVCNLNYGLTISGWDVKSSDVNNDNQSKDLMIAFTADQIANQPYETYNGVPTKFMHILSYIKGFTIKTDKDYSNGHDGTPGKEYKVGDMKDFTITNVSIRNIYEKADFKSGITPESHADMTGWTNHDDKSVANYTWFDGTASGKSFNNSATPIDPNGLYNNNKYLLVLPQNFANDGDADDPMIVIEYSYKYYNGITGEGNGWITINSGEVTKNLYDIHTDQNHAWDMNKAITYNLTISFTGGNPDDPDNPNSDLIYWAPDVMDWTPESHDDIVM